MKFYQINNRYYSQQQLLDHAHTQSTNGDVPEWERDAWMFIVRWFDDSNVLEVATSGSTGAPKLMEIEKCYFENSAKMTLNHLNLKAGDTALLCLSANYIAGKMMIIRALIGNLHLLITEPSSCPLSTLNTTVDFVAMVPLQVERTIENRGLLAFSNIRQLIIGGASISSSLKDKLQDIHTLVWATYGMTETVSHIALRRVNGVEASDWFVPLDDVMVSADGDHRLIIDAPRVAKQQVYTNDIVQLNENGHFCVVGRYDNIINSGGVKIVPERVESKISALINDRFIIDSTADTTLGQKVVLIIETSTPELYNEKQLIEEIRSMVDRFEAPKKVMFVDKFRETQSGKIIR